MEAVQLAGACPQVLSRTAVGTCRLESWQRGTFAWHRLSQGGKPERKTHRALRKFASHNVDQGSSINHRFHIPSLARSKGQLSGAKSQKRTFHARANNQPAATTFSPTEVSNTDDSVLDLKNQLLSAIEGLERGVKNAERPDRVAKVLDILREIDAKDCCPPVSAKVLTGDWKLLWTTEKETLFILQKVGVFGIAAGDVWQIIDAKSWSLKNIIEFSKRSYFGVTATISPSVPGSFRAVDFKFEAAQLVIQTFWGLRVPPFGKGWFRNIYVDDRIRIAKDSRKDWLIVERSKRTPTGS